MQLAELHGPLSAFAIGFHEISEYWVSQHRHMTENIVKNIRLLEVVELRLGSDKGPGRKPAIGEMVKENLIRHQFRHRHNAPSRDLFQLVRQFSHVRNT